MNRLCQLVSGTVLACTVIWQDSYPVESPQGFTGEIEVEVCEESLSLSVNIRERTLWGDVVFSDWKVVETRWYYFPEPPKCEECKVKP